MKNVDKPLIIGAVHLPYYGRNNPGLPIAQIEDYALQNVQVFYDNGIRTLYIQDENLTCGPAYPETIALLASLGKMLKTSFPELCLGFIVQAHDACASIAAAHASGADFVRIKVFAGSMYKAEGLRTGVGAEAVNYRTMLGSKVKILADVYDREGMPAGNAPLAMALGWADRFGADGFVLTGHDWAETLEYLDIADQEDLGKPVLVGGSVKEGNIYEVLDHCDGAVVSSSLMLDNPTEGSLLKWDAQKVRRFADKVEKYQVLS